MDKEIIPIENRNFPITAKQLAIFIGGIISVIITVMGTYYSITSKIDDNSSKWEALLTETKTIREEQKTMQISIQTMQLQIATMQAQYNFKNNER